jgi:hypothetical protein
MTRITRLLGVVAITALLAACVTPIPIDNLTYQGAASVRTDKTARIVMTSSGVGDSNSTYLMPAGGTFIAMTRNSGQSPFNVKDQQEFSQSLRKELVRLGVVKMATTDANEQTDMVATVNIDRAVLKSDFVEYTLDITMSITGGKDPFRQHYHIVSSEKDSLWTKMNTNGAEAREKLAQLMLERLIPDIEAYASAMTRQ